jgi:hypothetical protein
MLNHMFRVASIACIAAVAGGACVVGEGETTIDEDGVEIELADPDVLPGDIDITTGPLRDDANLIAATSGDCSQGGVEVWEHANFGGRSHYFCIGYFKDLTKYRGGLDGWFFWETWNDRITTLRVHGRVVVGMYSNAGPSGELKYLYPGQIANLGGSIWNDQISALSVWAYK